MHRRRPANIHRRALDRNTRETSSFEKGSNRWGAIVVDVFVDSDIHSESFALQVCALLIRDLLWCFDVEVPTGLDVYAEFANQVQRAAFPTANFLQRIPFVNLMAVDPKSLLRRDVL
jgi:hypothetical protein